MADSTTSTLARHRPTHAADFDAAWIARIVARAIELALTDAMIARRLPGDVARVTLVVTGRDGVDRRVFSYPERLTER